MLQRLYIVLYLLEEGYKVIEVIGSTHPRMVLLINHKQQDTQCEAGLNRNRPKCPSEGTGQEMLISCRVTIF